VPTTGSHPRSLVSLDYSQYHRYYHLSSWSSLAPRRARSGGQPRRTWGQAHELCSDRALRRPAVARCAAPPGAAPMPFPAFRCLHPKRAVALLGHQASGETALQKYRHAGTLKQAGLGVWGMRQHGESTRSCERAPPNKHTPQTPTFPLQRPMARDTRSRSPR
jgi:hypothetical protein